MKKFLFIILIMSLVFTTGLHASRNSDDIVTATNSAFNNYIQDVIGNKDDKNYGGSLMSISKYIATNAAAGSAVGDDTLLQVTTNKAEIRVVDSIVDIISNVVITNKAVLQSVALEVATNKTEIRVIDSIVDIISNIVITNKEEIRVIDSIVDVISNVVISNKTLIRAIDTVVDSVALEVATNKAEIRIIDGTVNIISNIVASNQVKIADIEEHFHGQSRVYPTAAAGSNQKSPGTAWAATNVTNTLIPASTITEEFDVYFLSIENISGNSVCEIVLINMTTHIEIGRCRITKNATQDGVMNVPIKTQIQEANSEIGWLVLSDTANIEVRLSVFYATH